MKIAVKVTSMPPALQRKLEVGKIRGRRLTEIVADPVFSSTSTFANFSFCSGGERSLHWASVCTAVTSAVWKTHRNGI